MDRYTATRLVMRVCVLALSVGAARGQVQVGELMISPAPDGVTVALAQPPGQFLVQPQFQTLSPQPDAAQAGILPLAQARASITRITLSSGDIAPAQPRSRSLPPLPMPRSHEMERDVLTMKAARAAMQLDDEVHDRKMASLR